MMHANNRTVNVKRTDLLSALKDGRARHVAEFDQAMIDYREAAEKFLSEALERAKAGDLSNLRFDLPRPESHVGEYDEVIAMMEMSVDDEISLDSGSFRAYVLGEWSWTHQLLKTTGALRSYLGKD